MDKHKRAGTLAQPSDLIDINKLINCYYEKIEHLDREKQKITFGTSGHRGSSFRYNYNEQHILAIAQAIADVRFRMEISGPCFLGKDTHGLSLPAFKNVIEVLVANGVHVFIDKNSEFTPTPVISHAIIEYNKKNINFADGIIITPSHNPPEDGGIKYNETNGGPADTTITAQIERRANDLLFDSPNSIKRIPYDVALKSDYIHFVDLMSDYVDDLKFVVDMDCIKNGRLKLAVDPLGGAGIAYWERIANDYQLDLTIVNKMIDPTFHFMHLDSDGAIRMDCSSASAMSGLLNLRHNFDLSFANDPDFDRHGIVTQNGLLEPNHYLAVAIDYLIKNRTNWSEDLIIGKTLVSSSMIDKIVNGSLRKLNEFPVGFKWFVDGLFDGKLAFAGEESAGASFLRNNGTVWTTDKDGILLCLLSAEIMNKTQQPLDDYYANLESKYGKFYYNRLQAPASFEEKQKLSKLNRKSISATKLAGEKITDLLTVAPANAAPIGGLKVVSEKGWFTARPSGTENAYKIYCESFVNDAHLKEIENEAIDLVNKAIQAD